jgi:hypothetical protein
MCSAINPRCNLVLLVSFLLPCFLVMFLVVFSLVLLVLFTLPEIKPDDDDDLLSRQPLILEIN